MEAPVTVLAAASASVQLARPVALRSSLHCKAAAYCWNYVHVRIWMQVRFFGKFFGTHADYYVFETTLKTPPEEPEQQHGECHTC